MPYGAVVKLCPPDLLFGTPTRAPPLPAGPPALIEKIISAMLSIILLMWKQVKMVAIMHVLAPLNLCIAVYMEGYT